MANVRVLTGVRRLDRTLSYLSTKSGNVVATGALVAAVKPVARAIKAAAPIGSSGRVYKGSPITPGGLRRSIWWRKKKNRHTGHLTQVKAGVNVGKQTSTRLKNRAPHAHLVGLGTDNRIGTKGRKRIGGKFAFLNPATRKQLRTGRGRPNPFVKKGYRSVAGTLPSIMTQRARVLLAREAAKARRSP